MPAEARELAHPWYSRVAEIPGLTSELEREFRFGQRVVMLDGTYRLGGTIKGGSSAMWVPASPELHVTYQRWARIEALPRVSRRVAYWRLVRLLRRHGIAIVNGSPGATRTFSPKLGTVYRLTRIVLEALPTHHLDSPAFATLQISGWGPDSAKASAYENGRVMLYDFAVKGARRTFLGLLLHEVGHACEAVVPPRERLALQRLHGVLLEARAFLGVEFLCDPASRQFYQANSFAEFLAETYMIYASQGERLRRHIAALPGEARAAWEAVYTRYVAWFGGMEYK